MSDIRVKDVYLYGISGDVLSYNEFRTTCRQRELDLAC